ncbi:pyrimidine operon attenuation protein/uracil phosphoribosyltransferase [Candidatus Omnitrophus magneticus]|uniref:Bifunctional protein PyrR n=1 Tax=Candidatus Omnitrophus magneticus TaxID=1609969 RepID=A0A0F0CST7_9BACT|nr:pyrimidine operon attenuation protein/uracil phosphoribosyltransferase [Candidatus Omnitrophus magneticus]
MEKGMAIKKKQNNPLARGQENKKKKAVKICNAKEIELALQRMADEIIEHNKTEKQLVVIGIKTRGEFLAKRLEGIISKKQKKEIPVGAMDITLYRDDLTEVAEQPVLRSTEISFDITEKIVILVDDVFFTGRTIRCALDEIIDFGRPRGIQLAVLIDRGHREIPIRPDFSGKNIITKKTDQIEVHLKESDKREDAVMLISEATAT